MMTINWSNLRTLAGGDNSRRHGRVRCELLSTSHGKHLFGEVADLSVSGMRVVHKGKLKHDTGDVINLTLDWQETSVALKAKIIWAHKLGFRKHLLGLEFEDVTASQSSAIQYIASIAINRLSMSSGRLKAPSK